MSIFNLASSADQLPSFNANMSRMIYEQYPPLRGVAGNAFPGSLIDIRFELNGVRWWNPSRTYLRMRAGLFQADGITPVALADDVAPNMGLMANIFTSAEFYIGNTVVSRITENMAQVDAMDKRLNKSKSWLDSAGKMNWWQPRFSQRQALVSSDGVLNSDVPLVPAAPVAISRLDAGFDALTTTAWTQATRILTFNLGNVNVITGPGQLGVGDVLIMNGAGNFGGGDRYEITAILTTTTVQANTQNVAFPPNVAAEVDDFTIIKVRVDNISEQRGGFEMLWQPPLGIFKVPHALPSGQYRLVLNPKSVDAYERDAIESILGEKQAGAGAGNFRFIVTDLHLYVNTVESDRVDDKVYFMSLNETRCQLDTVGNNQSLQQRFFDVSPSSYALAVAFQDQNATNSSLRSASKFKIRAGPTTPGGADLYLQRFYLNYGGVNRPQPDASPSFTSPLNYLSQMYANTALYSGQYFSPGGPESEDDWRIRGPYYYYAWPKDGHSESTRVTVNFAFGQLPGVDAANCLLFDLSRKLVIVTIKGGRVTDVQQQDA